MWPGNCECSWDSELGVNSSSVRKPVLETYPLFEGTRSDKYCTEIFEGLDHLTPDPSKRAQPVSAAQRVKLTFGAQRR